MKAYIIEELTQGIWEDCMNMYYMSEAEAIEDKKCLDDNYPECQFRVMPKELPELEPRINFDAPDKRERYGVSKNQLFKD